MAFSTETASELLSRLCKSQKIASTIFPGFATGRVIEVSGESGSGKSELLYSWTIHVLLPKNWKNMDLDGENGSVVFIDTNLQFSSFKLMTEMEAKILSKCMHANIQTPSQNELKDFVKHCMSSLYVLQCKSSEELLVTLLSFNELLPNLLNVTLLAIDSMTSFYWCDRMLNGDYIQRLEEHNNSMSKALSKILNENDIVLVATRQLLLKAEKNPSLVNGSGKIVRDYDFLGKRWQKLVTCQVWLQKEGINDSKTNIKVHLLSDSHYQQLYSVINNGGMCLLF